MGGEKQVSGKNILKILIATDKFKGCLTSAEAAASIAAGIKKMAESGRQILSLDVAEMADGGDGSVAVLQKCIAQGGVGECHTVFCEAVNPLGKTIQTSYIRYGNTAFIEMARISGLELLLPPERNPLHTTTYGLGEVIRHALNRGAEEILLSIGGSATNDGGTGLLQALGFRFLDAAQKELGQPYLCGEELERIAAVKLPEHILLNCHKKRVSFKVICDVTNPLLGENGATWVYGAQKGANREQQQRLERGMSRYVQAKTLFPDKTIAHFNSPDTPADTTPDKHRISPSHFASFPGAGAAGGVGFAATCYLGGELISGWRFFAKVTRLEERIAAADLVISGEGRIDSQSFQGKVIDGVAQLAAKYHKPLVLFCGISTLISEKEELPANTYIYTLSSLEPNKERSMARASELLTQLAASSISPLLPTTDNSSDDKG